MNHGMVTRSSSKRGFEETIIGDTSLKAQPPSKKKLLIPGKKMAKTVKVEQAPKSVVVTFKVYDAWFKLRDGVPPLGKPLLFAHRRQALCDTLPYFHAFKGSLHTQNGVARGFLLDGFAADTDVFQESVIITEVGGGKHLDSATGQTVRVRNALPTDINVKALKKSMDQKIPIAIIVGGKHPGWPCVKPKQYAYVVLDYFHVTDMWMEKEKGGFHVYKVRFEVLNTMKCYWWYTVHVPTLVPASPKPAPVKECSVCGKTSKTVSYYGWTCLTPECSAFYDIEAGAVRKPLYSAEFLQERTMYTGMPPAPLVPALPDLSKTHGTEEVTRKGVVCGRCGCCISRRDWHAWVCRNPGCDWKLKVPMKPLPCGTVIKEDEAFGKKIQRRRRANNITFDVDGLATLVHDPSSTLPQCLGMVTLAGYKVYQYLLPDNEGIIIGSFTLFVSNEEINDAEGGPNSLLRNIERSDIGLARYPAAIPGHKLEGLTRHFAQNFGAPYKYGVKVPSTAFSNAKEYILCALHMLRWAAKNAVRTTAKTLLETKESSAYKNVPFTQMQEFNELLALGYMEDDSISYHDDGEKELGPTVAALSLGSPSFMRFRPKWKANARFTGVHEKNAPGSRGKKCYGDVLEVPMKHGDMMVMHGADIQRYYDHAVSPEGERRFALTGRFVDPGRMAGDEEKEAAARDGVIPQWSYKKFAYPRGAPVA